MLISSSSLNFVATVQIENRIVIPPDVKELLKIRPKDKVLVTVAPIYSNIPRK